MRMYEVRIRYEGSVTTVNVNARDNAHAKSLVRIQYGDKVTVLEARPIKS